MLPVRRALISVSDKRGLADLARGLARMGVEIVSTGGTRQHLEEEGIPVLGVDEVTGFPEILDGRVKSLHPAIHGGILADRARASHLAELNEHGLTPIDLVVVNLYPFRQTAETPDVAFEKVVEMIDVGGPTMLRAAAKNFRGVVVVVDPDDYPQVLATLEEGERKLPEALRRGLAIKAFRHTQAYDAAIATWLEGQGQEGEAPLFLRHQTLDLVRFADLRYGENPHQPAAVYRTDGGGGIFGGFEQLGGKELSYNNLLDADAARKLVATFEEPAVVIVKHGNPCGVGRGEELVAAYRRALASDPVSAFGSVVAVNRPVGGELAVELAELFVEVLLAPAFDETALGALAAKKSLRLLAGPLFQPAEGDLELRAIDGGFLAQVPDVEDDDPEAWECPTRRSPEDEERRALALAWRVVRHVKSNAIVLCDGDGTLGIGAGQMSRVDSCRLAVEKARDQERNLTGAVAASDAFFPFRDGLDVLAEAGVTAVVQPGGSKRDEEVVAAANEHGVAMLLTGRRHFRH
jgi:phosphoribosylaminoimidazolecarboxamide formyltransferase / IMP cyclohydrolase